MDLFGRRKRWGALEAPYLSADAGRSVGLPSFVVGAFAAVVIAERLQLWQSGQVVAAVALMLALPLACAGLGTAGARWVTELDRALALRLLVGVVGLSGAWVFLVVQGRSWVVAVEAGLVALVLAPALLGLTLLALRPRARAGSLLARARERVHWCVVGGVACGGALLALPDWYGLREFYGSGTLVVWVAAGVALSTLAGCTLSSAWDLRRARRACRDEASLQPVAAGRVSASTRLLDIGVGDRMLGEVRGGGSAYRTSDEVASVVVGDPGLGASRLARAHRRLVWGCAAAVASVGVAAVCAFAWPQGPEATGIKSADTGMTEEAEQQASRPVSERVPSDPALRTLTPPGMW
jgi:hypothetical protein